MSNGLPASRAQPPAPAESARIALPPALSDSRRGEWVFRAAILVVVAASLVLAWWSFAYGLSPSLQESRKLVAEESKLRDQVDALSRQLAPVEAAEITNKFAEIPSRLFDGPGALEPWMADLKSQALALGLDIKAEIGRPVPQASPQKKISIVPASLSIEVQPGTNSSSVLAFPCQRLLRLNQLLTAQPKRVDIVELSLSGGLNSISHASMLLDCWVNDQ